MTRGRDEDARLREAEARLGAAEDKFRRLVEQLPAIVFTTEIRGPGKGNRSVYVSPRIEEILGFTQQEVMANPDFWATLLHPDDRERVLGAARKAIALQQPYSLECRVIHKDGRVLWLLSQGSPHLAGGAGAGDGTAPFGTFDGLLFDITARKAAEEEMARATQEAQARAEQLDTLNRITQRITSHRELAPMLDAVAREMVGLFSARNGAIALLTEDKRELRVVADFSLREGAAPLYGKALPILGTRTESEVVARGKPIAARRRETRSEPLRDLMSARGAESIMICPLLSRGQVIGVIALDTDRPDRTYSPAELGLAETVAGQVAGAVETARLLAEESRSRELAERLAAAAEALNASLDLEVVLPAILEHLGNVVAADGSSVLLAEDGGMRVIAVRGLPAGEVGRLRRFSDSPFHARLAEGGEPVIAETPEGSSLGVPLVVRDHVLGVLQCDSRTPGGYSSRDAEVARAFARHAGLAIDHARLYGEARRDRESAEAAARAKSQFLANVSHELRTPLNAILGFVQVMRQTPQRADTDIQSLGIISKSGERLLAQINDILAITKLETGRLTLDRTPFDLPGLLASLEHEHGAQAAARGLALAVESERVPAIVEGDPGKLWKALSALLDNAIKFTVRGRVVLRVRGERGGDPVEFRVTDTGPGLTDADRDGLFHTFSQAEAGRRAREGTGLGLAVAQGLVRLMGGEIRVESEPGAGAVFTFSIPLPPPPDAPASEGSAAVDARSAAHAEGIVVTGERLASQPAAWREALREALSAGDDGAARRVAEGTRERDPSLAEALEAEIRACRFDRLLGLLESVPSS